jgi:hypothetical protein
MLLAVPPRLKANIPLQSSCSSLDPRRVREFSTNHGGNAHLCACGAQTAPSLFVCLSRHNLWLWIIDSDGMIGTKK